MNLPRPIEWEIRGVLLIRGKPQNSQLGHGTGCTERQAIEDWRRRKVSQWAKDATFVRAFPAPSLTQISRRNSAVAAALTLLGSLALTGEPAWGVSEWNTLEIHTPSPRALVREGAICRIAQLAEHQTLTLGVLGSNPNAAAIFHGGSRMEGQERNYDTHQAILAPIDHGETCKTVYANHTHTECVTAGETAPISPTASKPTPTVCFNCRAENRTGIPRESEDTAADGGRLSL